jgi:phosphinothricin acetyltransferase
LARADDAEAIRAIYNVEVTTSTNVFDLVPRTSEEQSAWLEARSGAHAVVVGVDDDDRVIAFGALSPYRPRPAYSTTVEDSVYVDRAEQGRGVGKAVLARLVELAAAHGFHSVIGRIGGHNEASVAIHRACGFELLGVEREVGRKFGRWLDVVVMQRLLDERDRAVARSEAE